MWGPRYPGIQGDLADGLALSEICARQWRECVEAAIEALSAVPEDRHMTIRYDALVSGTEELGKVARFCGLSDIDLLLSEHSRRVRTRADDKWRYALSEHHKERMLPIVQPLLSSLGYSSSGVVA